MKTPKANVLALCPSAYLQELADDSTICIPVGDRKGPICLGRGINAREAWRSADRTLRVLRDALFQPADQGQTRQRIASFFDGKKPYTPAQMAKRTKATLSTMERHAQRTSRIPEQFPEAYAMSMLSSHYVRESHPSAFCTEGERDYRGRHYVVYADSRQTVILGEGPTGKQAWIAARATLLTTKQHQRSAAKR